ncbi:MAG: Rhein [Acidimicrobiia bacterium]|nr:Rhein [Acidimicrobiia bacterium]
MGAVLAWWGGSAALLILLAMAVGMRVTGRPLGILIDSRGRYSLTHTQLTIWTILILSLVSGLFFGRWQHHVADPLSFDIPPQVLGLLGISFGSAAANTIAKSSQDARHGEQVAATNGTTYKPRLSQIFLQETGTYADSVIDLTKFQNFVVTIVLAVAYTGLCIGNLNDLGVSGFNSLPRFTGTLLSLLGISHGAYLVGKLVPPTGIPQAELPTVAEPGAVALRTGTPGGPPSVAETPAAPVDVTEPKPAPKPEELVPAGL